MTYCTLLPFAEVSTVPPAMGTGKVLLFSAAVSASVSLCVALFTHQREVLFKRKELVSLAYQTALARVEMLYRIRRRSTDKRHEESDKMDIRNRFHKVQEDTTYYSTILTLESERLGEAYNKLIRKIGQEIGEKTQLAWRGDDGITKSQADIFDMAIIKKEEDAFLKEASRFTSGFWRRLHIWLRNKHDKNKEYET